MYKLIKKQAKSSHQSLKTAKSTMEQAQPRHLLNNVLLSAHRLVVVLVKGNIEKVVEVVLELLLSGVHLVQGVIRFLFFKI